jgi:hypothetical protein
VDGLVGFELVEDRLDLPATRPRVILRSRTHEGVYQEAWGCLCVHYALRALIHAADQGDLDPDRISFTKTLHAARRSVRTGLIDTVNLATALRHASPRSCTRCCPKRRLRANARVGRRKMSNNVKRATHRAWPTPTLPPAAPSVSSARPKLWVLALAAGEERSQRQRWAERLPLCLVLSESIGQQP